LTHIGILHGESGTVITWHRRAPGKVGADFVPQRLAALVGHIIKGQYPATPIDCGV
jgi:hypothetical protein